MNAHSLRRAALMAGAAAFWMLMPAQASAQDALTLQLEHFEPTADTTTNTLGVFGSSVLPHLHVNTLAMLHLAQEPLVFDPANGNNTQPQVLVADQMRAEFGASIGLFGLMSVDLVLPMILTQEQGQDLAPIGRPGQQTGGFQLQDMRLTPKISLMDRRYVANIGLAVALPIYIPLGDAQQLNGEDAFRLEPRLIGDWRYKSYSLSANLGYRLRRWSVASTVPLGVEGLTLQGSLFGNFPIAQRLFQTNTSPNQFFTSNPVEGLIGVRYQTPWQISFGLSGGGAITGGIGAASLRGIFTVAWTPPLPVDSDGDGNIDELDRCPNLAEDFDGYADSDGCPDNDNDKDQIPDVDDDCMTLAEDTDLFEDTDGCPDVDNHDPGYVPDPISVTGRVTVFGPTADFSGNANGLPPRARPSASPSKQYSVQGADVLGHMDSFAELQLEPVRVPGRNNDDLADWALMTTPLMALGLWGHSELNFDMPFFGGSGDASAVGDARVAYKTMFIDPANRPIGFSLSAPLIVPLQDSPFSNQAIDLSPTFIVDIDTSPLKTRLNLSPGAFVRTDEDGGFGGVLRYGVSGRYALLGEQMGLGAEIAGERTFDKFKRSKQDAIFSMNLAVDYTTMSGFTWSAGANVGLAPEQDLPEVGLFAGLSYTTEIADADNDGISDALDKCIVEPEDLDRFEDTDGCPELDNDQDQINDKDDACPLEPEDFDNLQDEDGCPEEDFDGDGILDEDDKCPDTPGPRLAQGCPARDADNDGILKEDQCEDDPEDFDGFQDEDGCPEPDNDGDTVLDGDDRCPELAGIIQWQGCRDVRVEVFFKTNSAKLLPRSFDTLNDMAQIIITNKTIGKVEVQGHTDDVGNARRNMKLSQARADSVRDYLIERGVSPDRLVAKGYGESVPAVSIKGIRKRKERKAAREKNRRVLFVLIE